MRGRTTYPANADGDGHSSNYDEGRRLLFSADEDFCKTAGSGTEKGFGYLRVWDYAEPGGADADRHVQDRERERQQGRQGGRLHDPQPAARRSTLYISWYTDGIRVVDARDPRRLREVAHFVPPAVNNPIQPSQRGTLTNTTQVWGGLRRRP